MKKRFRKLYCPVFGLLLCPALLAAPAWAGQTITINSNIGTVNVYGNGAPPNGSWNGVDPADLKDPNSNTVNIGSSAYVDGFVFGGYAESDSGSVQANSNKVTISGGTVDGHVLGGEAESDTGSATATGNTVTISGGEVDGDVYGGSAYSHGAADSATANSNTVNISGNAYVDNSVFGGYAFSYSGSVQANSNKVTISGGTVDGEAVFGGYAYSGGAADSTTATNNTVTISGAPTFGGNTTLYGGYTSGASAGDAFTGNTLNVWNYSGSAVYGVRNFENYNFILPPCTA